MLLDSSFMRAVLIVEFNYLTDEINDFEQNFNMLAVKVGVNYCRHG